MENSPINNSVEPLQSETESSQSSDYLYLQKLTFKPELRKSFLNFFVTNFKVVILLIALLSAWGLYSFTSLPRESNPEVKIPIAVVITSYPGASPADVEELVTKKIEAKISGLKDVDTISSNSANSISSVTVEFDAKADLEGSIRQLRDQINSVSNELPSEANEPIVREISFDDTPIWTMSLSSPVDGLTLRTYADHLKDELEKVSGVREVIVSGGEIMELEIAYDPAKLAFYNLSPTDVNQIIRGANVVIPAGNFSGNEFNYPVRVDARFYDAETLANLALTHSDNGAFVMLKDLATVKEASIEKTVYSRFGSSGGVSQDNVTIQIIKKTGSSIVDIVTGVEAIVETRIASMPAGTAYSVISNQGEQIEDDFDRLQHDFFLTLILVFGILFLIVGLKEALVAGLAVPLVFFATFGVMKIFGISLNFLSVFSLILALGLLVDDAIVVVSATKQYLKTGKFTPEEAVLLVLNDFKVVLLTTTLTTVWAFLPLLLSTGMIGEFIKSIPITVSVTLISSLIIALIINHPLAAVLERIRLTRGIFRIYVVSIVIVSSVSALLIDSYLRWVIIAVALLSLRTLFKWRADAGLAKMKANEVLVEQEWQDDDLIKLKLKEQGSHEDADFMSRLLHGIVKFDRFLPIYERYLRLVLATKKSRTKILLGIAGLFIIAVLLPVSGVVKNEFFPASDFDMIYVNVEAPAGLRLEETDKIVRQVEEYLLQHAEVISFATIVGSGGTGGDSLSLGASSSHLASITIKLSKPKERETKSYDISAEMTRDLAKISGAKINVESPRGGPPSGSAFEARIIGEDLQVLDQVTRDLETYLATINGVTNIKSSLKDSPADYTFTLDSARLEYYNLNAAYVGSILRMAISGSEVTTILREGEEIKVVARYDPAKIPSLESVQNLQILNLRKQPVFLKDVAKVELKPSVEAISRIDQQRTVTLSAGVLGKTNAQEVVKEFQDKIKSYDLPDGYEVKFGGENEANTESVMSILRAMILAALLIVSTLVIQFNSFKKAIIVLVTFPLALIGVFFGLAIVGVSLSFPGLIGILALFGIVVKNAIILIDKINLNINSGIDFTESVVDAGKSRLEAIFITSICTIIGIIPITLSDATWMALGSAVIFGLMLSSFLTLFIVPTLFVTLIKPGERF